jgi:hypothetical protein
VQATWLIELSCHEHYAVHRPGPACRFAHISRSPTTPSSGAQHGVHPGAERQQPQRLSSGGPRSNAHWMRARRADGACSLCFLRCVTSADHAMLMSWAELALHRAWCCLLPENPEPVALDGQYCVGFDIHLSWTTVPVHWRCSCNVTHACRSCAAFLAKSSLLSCMQYSQAATLPSKLNNTEHLTQNNGMVATEVNVWLRPGQCCCHHVPSLGDHNSRLCDA